ncbi:MAG TPA: hypothetical protein VE177_08025, partial [Candidatus Binatus sp.]|nr:hypothetical protein [Candidatus Binatus sp.]
IAEPMEKVGSLLIEHTNPVVLIGGFSSGHFSKETLALADRVYQVYPSGLEAWTVVGRAVYDYERALAKKKAST